MAFLDNSGDIILDAVLTDTGRLRLAQGNGSFKITKFALADDEIDYSLYDKDNNSGSAYYDLNLMQTPILEAFTNNTSVMKNKLLSIPRTDLLYLPILKINNIASSNRLFSETSNINNVFVVAVNADAESSLVTSAANSTGILKGENPENANFIRIDQGLDTTEFSNTQPLDSDLVETQYIIKIDNRFGSIVSTITGNPADVAFVDDDDVASYYLSLGTDDEFVKEMTPATSNNDQATTTIAGPRGTSLQLAIKSSLELRTSSFLFNKLGNTGTINSTSVQYIDSFITIEGATTGYRLSIPVRFVRLS